MLNPDEIYVLGKTAVDRNRDCYYQSMGTDIISRNPETFILNLNAMIDRLERIKGFAIEYQKSCKEEEEDEDQWL